MRRAPTSRRSRSARIARAGAWSRRATTSSSASAARGPACAERASPVAPTTTAVVMRMAHRDGAVRVQYAEVKARPAGLAERRGMTINRGQLTPRAVPDAPCNGEETSMKLLLTLLGVVLLIIAAVYF